MKITYDSIADALYIYIAPISLQRVAQTQTYQRLIVELDAAEQIVAVLLCGSSEFHLGQRLKYAPERSPFTYDSERDSLLIRFRQAIDGCRTVDWDANVDTDKEGQILGIEILFGGDLLGTDRLSFVRKYFIPFHVLSLEADF